MLSDTIPSLFEGVVARMPEAIAIDAVGGPCLTYKEVRKPWSAFSQLCVTRSCHLGQDFGCYGRDACHGFDSSLLQGDSKLDIGAVFPGPF